MEGDLSRVLHPPHNQIFNKKINISRDPPPSISKGFFFLHFESNTKTFLRLGKTKLLFHPPSLPITEIGRVDPYFR